ncbi:SDR family NAD(P)-dependent oxidoreductase [Acuticoccus kandeliae]|uniref:SDR family NAD(P)-dependent oxidoreductase n=1 Tax=Acuticoccus kandeliae TaxID=2073160 RepID=UPI000D3E91A4|nr:SDR family oxidoreductase [Acuticoccus kandeliae]
MRHAYELNGRRILITGAAAGIGAATAHVCAELGARVILVDRADATAVAEAIAAEGGVSEVHLADVSDRVSVEALAKEIGAVDALVLNAGICPFGDDWMDEDWDLAFRNVMGVNVLGPIHAARAFMPAMMSRGSGRVVLVGSVAGRLGGMVAGPHYVASKGGVHALVKWLAKRAAPAGVLVNGVAPASVDTHLIEGQRVNLDLIPLRRKGMPREIAWPIAFLCSDAASYICGTILDVNGGVYMN